MPTAVVTIKGVSPYSQSAHYDIPKNQGETSADYEARTWRYRCNTDADGNLIIPPMAFKNGIASAAKRLGMQVKGRGKSTYTKHFESGVLVLEPMSLGIHRDKVIGQTLFVPSSGIRGDGKRVVKTFPVVPEWGGVVTFEILDNAITEDVFRTHMEEFGKFTGIGRFRPQNNGYYGRFKVESVVWKK